MIKQFILSTLFFLNSTALPDVVKPKVEIQEFIFDNPPSPACHASSLVELPNHEIMAAWFGGPYEGHPNVKIWTATKSHGKWSMPKIVADGAMEEGKTYACWNPVLFKTAANLLILQYKVGPNPRNWWGMMKISKDGGKTWSAATRLPDGIIGAVKNKPIQLKSGTILYPSSTESNDEKIWNIHIEQSDENAKSFKKVSIDCGDFGVIQPSILTYPNGKLQLLCRSRQNFIVSTWSTDQGKTWSPLSKINLPNPNSGTDAVTLKNGLQLLVYNPLPAGNNWWDGRAVLRLAASKNGNDWTDIYTFEQHEKGEYSYPAIIQSRDSKIHISYTAERKKIKYVVLSLPKLKD